MQNNTIQQVSDFGTIFATVAWQRGDIAIFDIDDTLITLLDHQATSGWYEAGYESLIAQGKTADETKFILFQDHILAMYRTAVTLTDPFLPKRLAQLRANGIPVLCLTAREGRCLLYATLKHMRDVNLDFSQTDPHLSQPVTFPEITNYDTLYTSGILFTGGADKGNMLGLFFKKIGYAPTHIFFVDDKRANVESVGKYAKHAGISFSGFHLMPETAVILTSPPFPPLERNNPGA